MAKIHSLKVTNFRGIEEFNQTFGITDFVCIIGRGDSGKSTVLDAISYVLCGSWNLQIYDTDFHQCNVEKPIEIEATLYDLPKNLLREEKFGLYIQGLDSKTNTICDKIEDSHLEVLTIKFKVEKDLEPKWYIINGRQTPIEIKATDRASLNVFLVSDYIDRHFSWNMGSPLFSLLKENSTKLKDGGSSILDFLREAKSKIDGSSFNHLDSVASKVQQSASNLGIDISNIATTIDFKDISIKEGKISLHDSNIPFRLKGKGSKRLISIAIQTELAKSGGIILIDELEQGLEPDRAQHLAKTLKNTNKGQIFLTTHSRDVLVELKAEDLFLMKKSHRQLGRFDTTMQGVLRRNPEAFFAKKILVCEGATEIGICRSLNEYRIQSGKNNIAFSGVRFADGTGSTQVEYTKGFLSAGYKVCLFCDSDAPDINKQKEDLIARGALLIDCEENNAIENQIFLDIPWEGAKQLIDYKINQSQQEVIDSIQAKYKQDHGDLVPDWINTDTLELRQVIGKVAKKKEWFKSIEHGEILGKICCDHLPNMDSKFLSNQLEAISNWIDNA